MAQMNKQLKLPEIQKIMMEFEKQVCISLSVTETLSKIMKEEQISLK